MKKVLYILGKLDDADIDWLVEVGSRKNLPQGTELITQGKAMDSLFLVLDGALQVTSSYVKEPLGTLGSGEIVGELSFLDSRPPAASVTAVQDTTVLAIARSSIQAKLERDHGFGMRFYRALGAFVASRLRSTQVLLGYDSGHDLSETEFEDELDEDLLDDVALAGSRFEWLLERLRTGR